MHRKPRIIVCEVKQALSALCPSNLSHRDGLLLSFSLGFLIRLLPELVAHFDFIGFDTVEYASAIKEGTVWHHWSEIFSKTWLLYAIVIPLNRLFNMDISVTLNVVAPIMFGLNSVGIYQYARKALKWETRKSLFSSLVFCIGLASLRISWDLYRNTLGLAFLLFALSSIPQLEEGREALSFVLFSTLTVLSHELTAAVLVMVMMWMILKDGRKLDEEKIPRRKILLCSLPFFCIFLVGIYLKIHPIQYRIETNVSYTSEAAGLNPLGLPFFTNYLQVSTPVEKYSSYAELLLHVFSLFAIQYAIWMPFIIKGLLKARNLCVWTTTLLIGSFSALITPSFAIFLWDRWMFMLIYPFTFYAVNGMEKIRNELHSKWTDRGTAVFIAAMIVVGLLYTSLPPECTPFYTPMTCKYLPSSMQQSTIPLQDIGDTLNCLDWLNKNMDADSTLLVHHAFFWWGQLSLDKNHTMICYTMDSMKAVQLAQEEGYNQTYLIWWGQSIGWYKNIQVPESLKAVYSQGRICIYG